VCFDVSLLVTENRTGRIACSFLFLVFSSGASSLTVVVPFLPGQPSQPFRRIDRFALLSFGAISKRRPSAHVLDSIDDGIICAFRSRMTYRCCECGGRWAALSLHCHARLPYCCVDVKISEFEGEIYGSRAQTFLQM
jgi:hypothetical protein